MDELREMLYCELDEMTKSGELSMGSIKAIGEILDAIKDIETIEAMSQGGYSSEEGGNSMRGRYYRDGYAREGSYEGNSYRKRNRMGQFSRYSRDGEKEQLMEKLETLMNDTTNGGDRAELRQSIMDVVNKYK
jgi:hypothetical protein